MIAGRLGCAAAVAVLSCPTLAAAHATDRAFVLLLPTGYYLAGGTAAVALSFCVLALAPDRLFVRFFHRRRSWKLAPTGWGRLAGMIGFGVFVALIAAGLYGTGDPLANPLPLAVWTFWWVGLTLLTALLGNVWALIHPWRFPCWLAARLPGGSRIGRITLPERLGYTPAIVGLMAFAWFELVDPAPDNPQRLAWAAGAYWAINLSAMLIFGQRDWLRRGECFSVFFGLVARLAPLWTSQGPEGRRLHVGAPGSQLLRMAPLPPSGALFILLGLATVSFDGLNKTFWWLSRIGVNPLEFPGRTALAPVNSAGLVGAWLVLAAAYFLAIAAGCRAAGVPGRRRQSAGRLAASILPIALAYHFAHYLVALLVNGQYGLAALSDPLGSGADLFGLGPHFVTTSFLYDLDTVGTIWGFQAGAIVIGHVAAVLTAHAIAIEIHGGRRRAVILSQLPLAVLMVAYTLFGLWLLASPTGA